MSSIDDTYSCKAEAHEASEDVPSNRSTAPTIGDVINARYNRRDVLRGGVGRASADAPQSYFEAEAEARANRSGMWR